MSDSSFSSSSAVSQLSNSLHSGSPEPSWAIIFLCVLATLGLAFMWHSFWSAVSKTQESVHKILSSVAFFRTVTVMGVIAATVVLSLASKLDGSITGSILSGIVGYVLGQISSRNNERQVPEPKDNAK